MTFQEVLITSSELLTLRIVCNPQGIKKIGETTQRSNMNSETKRSGGPKEAYIS